MIDLPLIIYIPGLRPKPEPSKHRDALFRCLISGIRRQDEQVALDIASNLHCFDLVSWTYDFYGEYRDIAIDAEAIDAVTQQPFATEQDILEATNWKRRFVRRLFVLADFLPFLIPHVANERIEMHLQDLRRYLRNRDDIAEHTRQLLKMPLRAAAESNRPILLLTHSMGSVIAYDSLWQLTHDHRDEVSIDLFVTMGSPLGQRYVQGRIKGNSAEGGDRYPDNISRWINLTSQGDLTAVDPTLADDFGEMAELGLVECIEDERVFNYFRLNGQLNVHAEYGYLANDTTARIVADWWRRQRPQQ
jgi:hypothetical protein